MTTFVSGSASRICRVASRPFINGMWQRLAEQGNPDTPPRPDFEPRAVNPWGVNLGAWAEIMRIRAGFSFFQGKGLGMNNTLENTPIVFDGEGEPRKFDGYYAVLGLNLHPLTLNAGFGITHLGRIGGALAGS